MLTSITSNTRGSASYTPTALALLQKQIHLSTGNLAIKNWFHSLTPQRFQALLTLFSKSFSPFPHGTCLLSVSSRYLALDENYHPFSAPIPKYATLNSAPNAMGSERRKYGILTLYDAFFQKDLRPVRHW